MSLLPAFDHARPTTIDEALALLDDGALPYHGGTELLAVMRVGLLRPERLVDLKALAELAGVARDGDKLVIGGGTRHRQLATDGLVSTEAPLLGEVAGVVGNVRVRASGTVAGNLCFAEPKSDLTTVLVALEATVTLRSAAEERTVTLDEFLLGAYSTDLQSGELLTRVIVPAGFAKVGAYRKFQTAERPTVGVAVVVSDAIRPKYRVVVGAVGERPVAFHAADPADFDPRAMAEELDVIPDLTGAEDYKRQVTAVTIGRAIADLRDRMTR